MTTVGDERRFDVTIAGETNLDLILYGLPSVMPVERELLATGFRMTLGGSSAITAHNLAVLGARVGFVTRTGRDEMGTLAMTRMAQSGVDLSACQTTDGSTGTGVTLLLPHGPERHILTYPGVMTEMTCADLPWEYLSASRHFHLSSFFLQRGLHDGLPELLRRLKAAGLTISMDTNDDPEDRWNGVLNEVLASVDVLLPNEREVCRIAGTTDLDRALARLGERISTIVVKCGAQGALVQHKGERQPIKGVLVTPVDTIGAGDSFNAGFLLAYLRGCTVLEAARVGTVTGALSTLGCGGTEAWRDGQLREQFLSEHGVSGSLGCAQPR